APADGTPSAAAEAAAAAANSGAMPAPTDAAPADPSTAGADAAVEAVAQASSNAGGLVPGTDYVEIKGGQPYAPLNGKIEVVEVFNFICPACARFEPLLSAWKRKLPADVRLTYLPADFNAQWQPYARAYLVAEGMGLDERTHEAVFNAIHLAHTLPGEADPVDEGKIAAFYGQHGADPKQFLDAMHSFAVTAKLARAKQFLLASGVEGTPTIIVDGKYRVTGKGDEDVLRITNQLIAQERAANAAPGAAGR
ncbi:thiol:disulfide interchange protein DsbA/DsbL, partial [Cognatiluteimonas telluris]|uniref:thiol:disulfide interchange protein DsbA/DsbL n=1 Tax=Cognatiluteimonas telluris TaxID=1104775 RepID=UPI001A9C9F58